MPAEAHGDETAAAVAETHTGIVVFAGDRAYKVKKPVDVGFADFTTRESRHAACHREVELNRRFSPDVYLGVADVSGPDGEPCDHMVVMRRMPAARRLAALLRPEHADGSAGATPVDVDAALLTVARRLAEWHARAPRGPLISAEGTRDALRGRWTATFDQLRPFHGGVLDAAAAADVEEQTLRFLAGRAALFEQRIDAGRVVDGHGDLLATDIFCLDDGPRILDCLEFDDRLRYVDGLDDAAFLAMDLERLGAADLAARFLDRYAEFAADPAPRALRHHYLAYRAFVRAKVACLRYAQGEQSAAADVAELTALTRKHLTAGRVRLVLVGGAPGTGKSTVAGRLAGRLGGTLLSSDRVRKELAGLDDDDRAAAPYGTGLYSGDWTERTYAELLDRAERRLALGETVVLDASWHSAPRRAAARRLAAAANAEPVELRCAAAPELAAERMRRRARGPSDADAAIAAAMAADTDAWPEATVIDTSGTPDDSVRQAAHAAE